MQCAWLLWLTTGTFFVHEVGIFGCKMSVFVQIGSDHFSSKTAHSCLKKMVIFGHKVVTFGHNMEIFCSL